MKCLEGICYCQYTSLRCKNPVTNVNTGVKQGQDNGNGSECDERDGCRHENELDDAFFLTEAVRRKWFAVIITPFDTCHRMVEPSPAWYFFGLVTKTFLFADFSRIDVKGCVFNKRTIKFCVSFC